MVLPHHPFIRHTARRHATHRRRIDRLGPLLRSAAVKEPIFSVCVTLVALHLAALALLLPGHVSALLRMAMLVCAALGPPALVLWFDQHGRAGRVLAAAIIGLAATIGGLATSVPHAVLTGPSVTDYTGIAATAAGIVLIVLAFRDAVRGRTTVVKLALAIPVSFLVAQWLIMPAINVGIITNAPRPVTAPATTLGLAGARDVSFPAADGVRLAGWYVPGRTGAAVILLHGSHGTRSDTLAHLRMLVAGGYAVLAFDARGHGQSQGKTNALGWGGAADVAGAVSFLEHQPGVDPHRIAALGLSMGAEEALRAAAGGVPLRAIVADGAGASTQSDEQLLAHGVGPVFASVTWLTMRGTELVSGETEPTGLSRIVAHIQVPVLLIASNANGEKTIEGIYRERIGGNASLWYVANAGHTGGLSTDPAQYKARVDSFLAGALR